MLSLSVLLLFAVPRVCAQTSRNAREEIRAKTPAKRRIVREEARLHRASCRQTLLEKQLAQLSRALRDDGRTRQRMRRFPHLPREMPRMEFGARAALALGYYDLSRDKPDLALGWLRKAVDDKLLREYVQYWQAQASLALGQKEEAIEQLQSFRRDFPGQRDDRTGRHFPGADGACRLAKAKTRSRRWTPIRIRLPSPRCFCCGRRRRKKLAAAKGEKPAVRGRGLSRSLLSLSFER